MLAWLFTQYRTAGDLRFGSKWLSLHGRLFLGSPESYGMGHLSEQVRRSYYYLRADRVPPVDDANAYTNWTKDRLYASQVQQVSERWVAKASFVVGASLCVALCVGGWLVRKAEAPPPPAFAIVTPAVVAAQGGA